MVLLDVLVAIASLRHLRPHFYRARGDVPCWSCRRRKCRGDYIAVADGPAQTGLVEFDCLMQGSSPLACRDGGPRNDGSPCLEYDVLVCGQQVELS
jgi:hypothetical protein